MNSYLNSLYLSLKYHLLSINWNHRRDEFIFPPFHSYIHAYMHACMHAHLFWFIHLVSHSCVHAFIHSFTAVFKVFHNFWWFDLYLFTFERHKAQQPRVKVRKINLKRICFLALNYGINFQKMSSWPIMLKFLSLS